MMFTPSDAADDYPAAADDQRPTAARACRAPSPRFGDAPDRRERPARVRDVVRAVRERVHARRRAPAGTSAASPPRRRSARRWRARRAPRATRQTPPTPWSRRTKGSCAPAPTRAARSGTQTRVAPPLPPRASLPASSPRKAARRAPGRARRGLARVPSRLGNDANESRRGRARGETSTISTRPSVAMSADTRAVSSQRNARRSRRALRWPAESAPRTSPWPSAPNASTPAAQRRQERRRRRGAPAPTPRHTNAVFPAGHASVLPRDAVPLVSSRNVFRAAVRPTIAGSAASAARGGPRGAARGRGARRTGSRRRRRSGWARTPTRG